MDKMIEDIRRAVAIAMLADTNIILTVEQAAHLINEYDKLKEKQNEK